MTNCLLRAADRKSGTAMTIFRAVYSVTLVEVQDFKEQIQVAFPRSLRGQRCSNLTPRNAHEGAITRPSATPCSEAASERMLG